MKQLTIYSTSTCPYCHMEKEYLKSKNIDFVDKVVDTDTEALAEMMQLSGQLAVPFTVIKKEVGREEKILGFDKPRLDKILGL